MLVRGEVQYHQPGQGRAEILIDADGVPGRRIDPEYRWELVTLADARRSTPPSFEEHGLCFVEAPSCLQGPESFEASRVEHERELVELIERELGAVEVEVFDHTLRIEGQGYRPPSYHVHCDYNAHSASTRLREQLGDERAEAWLRGRFAVINVWRPLGHPVERSPLGFVLPHSVAAEDWVEVDIVFPHRRGQIRGLAWSDAHQWIHLGHMQPHEAAVFTVYANEGVGGVAHAAVRLIDGPAEARPRQSIESRMFVRWG